MNDQVDFFGKVKKRGKKKFRAIKASKEKLTLSLLKWFVPSEVYLLLSWKWTLVERIRFTDVDVALTRLNIYLTP